MRGTLRIAACVLLCGLAAGGCAKTIWITQIPEFYSPDLQNIAVVPFRGVPGARAAVADHLAAALAANGTYTVYNRGHLRSLLDERDIQIAFGDDDAAAAESVRKLGKVQAILTGTVLNYTATSNRQRKRDPIWKYNKKTKKRYLAGYKDYVHTRNEANVAVTATLIRVADGRPIHSTAGLVEGRAWAEGSPPRRDRFACLHEATGLTVQRLVEEFAVVRRQIKVNPSKVLRTASEFYDGKWAFTDEFAARDEKGFIVVTLPDECDRNRFRLVIVREGLREELAELKITWQRGDGSRGFAFSPRDVAARGGGPGTYVIKFYCGQEPKITRKLTIGD